MLFFLLIDVSFYFYNCQKNISLVTFWRNIEMIFKIIVLNFKKAEVKKEKAVKYVSSSFRGLHILHKKYESKHKKRDCLL